MKSDTASTSIGDSSDTPGDEVEEDDDAVIEVSSLESIMKLANQTVSGKTDAKFLGNVGALM